MTTPTILHRRQRLRNLGHSTHLLRYKAMVHHTHLFHITLRRHMEVTNWYLYRHQVLMAINLIRSNTVMGLLHMDRLLPLRCLLQVV